MQTINIREARRRLSELVEAARRGESITITRRGKVVARLVPPDSAAPKRFPDLTCFRESIKIEGKPLSETVIEMRGEERD